MKNCTILVVDDEPELREIIDCVLTGAGHRVTLASGGHEAIQQISQQRFDLVLTDLLMPEKDGIQVIAELRRKFPEVRIIAMSGGGHVPREHYLKIAKGLGAHALLGKPFSGAELFAAIDAVMPDPG